MVGLKVPYGLGCRVLSCGESESSHLASADPELL